MLVNKRFNLKKEKLFSFDIYHRVIAFTSQTLSTDIITDWKNKQDYDILTFPVWDETKCEPNVEFLNRQSLLGTQCHTDEHMWGLGLYLIHNMNSYLVLCEGCSYRNSLVNSLMAQHTCLHSSALTRRGIKD